MQQVRDICSGDECGVLSLIVNKKYWLCDNCNFKRLHNGQSKEEVYRARADQREPKQKDLSKSKFNREWGSGHNKKLQLDSESLQKIGVTKASKLASVSKTKRYRCSDGQLVSQAEIKWRLQLTHDKIKETRLPVCEGLGKGGLPLSFSHTISVARCKDMGKSELIWDEDNIFLESFHEPSSLPVYAHNIWESGTIEQKIQLLNFEQKLEYIEKHDQETFRKYMIKLDEYEKQINKEASLQN